MTLLTLSDDQVRILTGASTAVVVVDSRGKELGKLQPVMPEAGQSLDSDDDWAEAKRRMEQYKREGGPLYTTKEVLEYLRSLKPERITSQ